jgi:hypothetical protein
VAVKLAAKLYQKNKHLSNLESSQDSEIISPRDSPPGGVSLQIEDNQLTDTWSSRPVSTPKSGKAKSSNSRGAPSPTSQASTLASLTMPSFDDEFWVSYLNILRAFGTKEKKVCFEEG